jgi:hypothetical protein
VNGDPVLESQLFFKGFVNFEDEFREVMSNFQMDSASRKCRYVVYVFEESHMFQIYSVQN